MELTIELLHLFDNRLTKTELEEMDDYTISKLVDQELDYLKRHKFEEQAKSMQK